MRGLKNEFAPGGAPPPPPVPGVPPPPPSPAGGAFAFEGRLEAHVREVTALLYFGEFLISGSSDTTLRVWSAATRTCQAVINRENGGPTHSVTSLCLLRHEGAEVASRSYSLRPCHRLSSCGERATRGVAVATMASCPSWAVRSYATAAIARLIADTDSFLWRLCCVSALRSITRDLLFRRWCWDDSRTVASSFD